MSEIPNTEILERLKLLRKPFEVCQISLLPKPYKADSPKGKCAECGGYHGLPAVHLSYVGHAALTDRLLDVDPLWTWEPLAVTQEGLPLLDKDGGLWIKLTICGITRLGYGDAGSKTGPNATKERIGDALRNAGMRFGMALDLWHKGELHQDSDEPQPPQRQETQKAATLHVVNGGTSEPNDTELFNQCKQKRDACLGEGEKANIWNVIASLVNGDPETLRTDEAKRHQSFLVALQKPDTEWRSTVYLCAGREPSLDMGANEPTADSARTVAAIIGGHS